MTPQFVARLAANSNDCFCSHIRPALGRNQRSGMEWSDIAVADMCHFLGMMLKMSLASIDGGGY